jgi:hypothetical protein
MRSGITGEDVKETDMECNEALCNVLTAVPVLTCTLAAIGLATVFACFWTVVKPFFVFLSSNNLVIAVSLGTCLIVLGCTSWGYASNEMHGAYMGGGVSATILGGLHLAWQWLRHCIKWSHNELHDGGL